MNASELKYQFEQAHPESPYFSRENMRHAGDTMKNYGVRSAKVAREDGLFVEAWELYRKRPTSQGDTASAYFAKGTLRLIHNIKG